MAASIGKVQGLLKTKPKQDFLEELTLLLRTDNYQKPPTFTEESGHKMFATRKCHFQCPEGREKVSQRGQGQQSGRAGAVARDRERLEKEAGHSLWAGRWVSAECSSL